MRADVLLRGALALASRIAGFNVIARLEFNPVQGYDIFAGPGAGAVFPRVSHDMYPASPGFHSVAGRVDYVVTPDARDASHVYFAIETKANGHDLRDGSDAETQLLMEMVAISARNYVRHGRSTVSFRGVLTDGSIWRFYQISPLLFAGAPALGRAPLHFSRLSSVTLDPVVGPAFAFNTFFLLSRVVDEIVAAMIQMGP